MIPVIRIGQLSFSTYWMMLVFGAGLMFFITYLRKERFGINTAQAVLLTVLLTIIGVSGTKIMFVIEHFEDVLENGLTLAGLSFFGAIFLVPIVIPLFRRLFSMSREQILDASSLCGYAMVAVLRFGCFLNGCCGGIESTMFGFTFHWPTQAIESIWDFFMLATLYQLEKTEKYTGQLYPMFMVSYSAFRFCIEFLRDTPKDMLMMSSGQWCAIVAIIVGAAWFIRVGKKGSD